MILSFLSLLSSLLFVPLIQSENCPRYSPGTSLTSPDSVSSSHGYLDLHATYETRWDSTHNLTLFCYMTNGKQSPTLRVSPGETILFTLKNNAQDGPDEVMMELPDSCGTKWMVTPSATNIHYHGLHSPPLCHVEDTTFTVINYGEEYTYDLEIPNTQPPGLYWYHPHIHGTAERALQGGATGAIIVEGIENVQPAVAGLPEQVIILRDYGSANDEFPNPSFEITVNYHYVPSPDYTPADFPVQPNQKQFWRILNAASDAIFDLQFIYDSVAQPFDIVSHDGVVHHDSHNMPALLKDQKSVYLSSGGRVELIITTPSDTVTSAYFKTLAVDTGSEGDYDPERNILRLLPDSSIPTSEVIIPQPVHQHPIVDISKKVMKMTPKENRLLYFSSISMNPADPESDTIFFITVDGQTPTAFSIDSLSRSASIVAEADSVEDWTIQNRALETHIFHIHQLHFLLFKINGQAISSDQKQFHDTVPIPPWDGVSAYYPNITIRIYFSKDIRGKFVYHCHILEHEDKGMMAIIEVVDPVLPLQDRDELFSGSIFGSGLLKTIELDSTLALGAFVLFLAFALVGFTLRQRTAQIQQNLSDCDGESDTSSRSMVSGVPV